MKRTKYSVRLLIAIVMSFALLITACSSGKKDPDPVTSPGAASPDASKAPEKVKLTLIAYNHESVDIEAAFKNFHDTHPNIEVTLKSLPNNEAEYFKTLDVAIAGNEKMDIILVEKDRAGQKGAQGVLHELNSLAEADGNFDIVDNYGDVMEGTKIDGKFYYVPYNIDFDVIYYNKDMFAEKGLTTYPNENMTIAELGELAKQLTSGEGANKVYGFIWGYQSYNSLLRLIESGGWEWFKEDGSPNLDDPRVKELFVTFKELFDVGAVPTIANMKLEKMNNRLELAQKKAAIIIRNWWTPVQWNSMRFNDKVMWTDGIDFEIGMSHIPRFEANAEPRLQHIQPGYGYAVAAKTEHPQEAWEFIKFMTSTRYEMAERLTVIPAYTKISDEKFFTIYNEYMTPDGELLKDMYPADVAETHKKIKDEIVPTSSKFQLRTVDGGELQAVKDVIEREGVEYFNGNVDIDTFIAKLQSESEKILSTIKK